MPALNAPSGAICFCYGGREYSVVNGQLELPRDLWDEAKAHGYWDPANPPKPPVSESVSIPRQYIERLLAKHGVAVPLSMPDADLVETVKWVAIRLDEAYQRPPQSFDRAQMVPQRPHAMTKAHDVSQEDDLSEMKRAGLYKMATDMGLDLSHNPTNNELVSLIREARAKAGE